MISKNCEEKLVSKVENSKGLTKYFWMTVCWTILVVSLTPDYLYHRYKEINEKWFNDKR